MAKFLVTYSETLSRTLLVEAESAQEAADRVEKAFDAGDLELTAEDYVSDSAEIETQTVGEGEEGWYDRLDKLLAA